MQFLPADIENYIVAHSAEEPELLKQLTRETHQKILQPIMLSSPYQGRVLSILSKLIQPKTILEIGTFTGYATLCLAEGLAKNGTIHTIDINEELATIQRKYFEASPVGNQIIQHLGNALEIIPKLNCAFDLIFIDADKPNYCKYFELVIDKLNKGGILLSDNVLWHGKVVKATQVNDTATNVLKAYNSLLNKDPRLETVILPIRDGLTLSRKL